MADEVRTLLARLRPELTADKFQADLGKLNESVVKFGRTSEGVFKQFEDMGNGKVSGDKIIRVVEQVMKKNDEAIRQSAQYQAALEQLQKVSQYMNFSQLAAQLDGINGRFKALPPSLKLAQDQLNAFVAGSVLGLEKLQASALMSTRAIQALKDERGSQSINSSQAINSRLGIGQPTRMDQEDAQKYEAAWVKALDARAAATAKVKAAQQALREEEGRTSVNSASAINSRLGIGVIPETAKRASDMAAALAERDRFMAEAARIERDFGAIWDRIQARAAAGAAAVNASFVKAFNERVGIGTSALPGSEARYDRRADATAGFSAMPTDAAQAQKLVSQYDRLGAAIDKVKADQAELNRLLANTGPIQGATAALKMMEVQLHLLEKEQQNLGKSTGNLYRQNQILQSGLLNTFQSLAAGQSVMSTLFIQGTQLVGGFSNLNTAFLLAAAGAAVVVASFGAMAAVIAKTGDEAVQAQARINSFVKDMRETERIYVNLQRLGSNTGVRANESAGMFQRLLVGAEQIGATNDQVLRLVENFQKLGTIGGGSVQQINAGMQQFVQAMSKGKLDGDELRSVFENLPLVARALGQELGKSNAELRAMGAAGTLTSQVVFQAILNQSRQIDQTFARMPVTMERAWNMFGVEIERLLVALDRTLGFSQGIAAAFQAAARTVGAIRVGLSLEPPTEAATRRANEEAQVRREQLELNAEVRRLSTAPTGETARQTADRLRQRSTTQDRLDNVPIRVLGLVEGMRFLEAQTTAREGDARLISPYPGSAGEPNAPGDRTPPAGGNTAEPGRSGTSGTPRVQTATEILQGQSSPYAINFRFDADRRVLQVEQNRAQAEIEAVAAERARRRTGDQIVNPRDGGRDTGAEAAETARLAAARTSLTNVTAGLTQVEAERKKALEALTAGTRRDAAAAQREIEALEEAIERANTGAERRNTSTEVRGYLNIVDTLKNYRDGLRGAAGDQGLLTRAGIAQAAVLETLNTRMAQETRALRNNTTEAEDRNRITALEAIGTAESRVEIDRITQARALEAIEIQRGNDLRKLNIDLNAALASGPQARALADSLREQIELRGQLYDRQRAAATDPILTSAARETIQNQQRALDGATKAASDFFYNAFNGKMDNIGKSLTDALKRGIADGLAEEFIKPLLRPIINSIIGSGTGTGAGTGLINGILSLVGLNPQQGVINQAIAGNQTITQGSFLTTTQGNAASQNVGASLAAGTRFLSGGTAGEGRTAEPVFNAGLTPGSVVENAGTMSNANRIASFSGTRIFTPGYQMSGMGPINGVANYTFGDAATGVGTAEMSSGLGQVSVGQFAGGALGILGGGYGIYSGLQRGDTKGYVQAAGGAVGVVGGVAGIATAANVAGAGVAAAGGASAAGIGMAGTAIAATAAWAPYIAAIIAIVALLWPEQKASNREGNATLDTESGQITLGGQTGGKISYQNRDAAGKLAEGVRGFTEEIDKLVGFNVKSQLVVGMGDRDGIFYGEQGRSRNTVANDEQGAMAAIEGLSRIVLVRAAEQATDLSLRHVINVALKGSSLTALEDIRWYKDVYQKIGTGPVEAVSDLQKTFDALDTSFKELRDKINSFGLSTEALDAEVQRQRDLIIKQRDAEYTAGIEGFRLRRDQVDPNMSPETLELKVFDLKAADERKNATQKVFNLGLEGTQQSLWFMGELEATLAAERLAVQQKYVTSSLAIAQQEAAAREQLNRNAQALLEKLTYGELGGLSPGVRYALGRQSLDEVKAKLYDTDGATDTDVQNFVAKASELLPQFKDFLGISSEYGGLAAEVANILTTLRPDSDPAKLVPVLLQQTVGLSQVEMAMLQTGQASAELLTKILSELSRLTAQNQALLDRQLGR